MKIPAVGLTVTLAVGSFLIGVKGAPTARDALPVCVVGAGPSGLVVANNLEAKGHKVVVFEKRDTLGGKCQRYIDPVDGSYHPLGALIFSNGTYIEALKIINQVGVLSTPLYTGQRWDFNISTGAETEGASLTPELVTLLTSEFERYALYWSTEWAPYNAIRYKNGVPTEFTVTTAEWLANNNFQVLPILFIQAMVAFGYGDYRELPILYMLTYLTPDVLGYFASLHEVYLIDFHEVFLRYANTISGPILLNTHITSIDRTGANPVITYQSNVPSPSIYSFANTTTPSFYPNTSTPATNSSSHIQQCSSVVLAFPPTVSSLAAANLALSPSEIDVFGPVHLNAYYSAAVNMPEVPYGLSFSADSSSPYLPAPADGEPVYWLRLFPTSAIATTWSWSATPSASSAYALLKSTLSLLDRDPREPSVSAPVVDADVRAFVAPDYFPHYDTDALAGGVYERYNALQGANNTYYCSALSGFEIVEFAVRAGIELVETFF